MGEPQKRHAVTGYRVELHLKIVSSGSFRVRHHSRAAMMAVDLGTIHALHSAPAMRGNGNELVHENMELD